MSNFDWDDDDAFEDAQAESNAMKELRKAYREMKKQNKELLENLTNMKNSVRERSVKDVLASKGLPEKISKFIPEDVTSAEEVEAWVAEYGDVFGATPQSEEQPAAPNPELQALSRIANVQNTGETYAGDPDQLDALIRAAQTPEELNRVLFGNALGPQAI